ncbi:hypothetical protein BKA64DRAFT_674878 [Cadophora sp. MPI-SDFR-AT-0126]|nr:hypothetical protein BKA64DRAFT_674878 [Leotiomycetes sp. MPI-SDFR-AT-0126]
MASTAAIASLASLDHFTLFDKLPKELRVMIWHCTFIPRVVEILASEYCTGGFYSQAELPIALHVNKESRHEVQRHYSICFGSFLQPARTLFNYDIDVLYFDIALEEDCLHRLFGVLKQEELAKLKHVAIDETYLWLEGHGQGQSTDQSSTTAGLRKAMKAMTSLKEMIVVREIENDTRPRYQGREPKVQIKFCDGDELGQIDEGWVENAGELLDVKKELKWWKLDKSVQMTAVYGWRTL